MKKEKTFNKMINFEANTKSTRDIVHSPCVRMTQHKKSLLYHFPQKVTLAKFKRTKDKKVLYYSEYYPELNSLTSHKSFLTISYYSQLESKTCLMITYDTKGENYFAKKTSHLKTDRRMRVAIGDSWNEFIYNLTGLGIFNGETCYND